MANWLVVQLRKVMKPCRRHPVVVLAVVVLTTFLYVFTIGKNDWDKSKSQMFPFPSPAEDPSVRQNEDKQQIEQKPANVTEPHDFPTDQKLRLARIKEVCANPNRPQGMVNSIITRSNLTYCVIPRSANTFWLQVYRYINFDYLERNPESPFDLDVHQVHNRPFGKTRMYTWRRLTEVERKSLLRTRIFLSVQDPYQRLWSTYLNSLILPELWNTVGIKIEVKRREGQVVKRKSKPTPTCGSDVTFPEFVEFALTSFEGDYSTYYQQCDPCQLSPTYVIKSETSLRDNQHILTHLNLSWAIEAPDFEEEMIKRYIKTTILDNFAQMKNPAVQSCALYGDIARRLWKVFMAQGFIPEDAQHPKFDDIVQNVLINIVTDAYFTRKQQGVDMEAERRRFMVAAFKHLKMDMLKRIQDKYRIDFQLFGYDESPPDIFGPLT